MTLLAVQQPSRLIFCDLDGTLLTDKRELGEDTLRAAGELRRLGCFVVIASARPPRSSAKFARELSAADVQINYNGAMVWDAVNRVPLMHEPLDAQTVRDVVRRARERMPEVLMSCERMDAWYTDGHDEQWTTETGRLFSPDVIGPMDLWLHDGVTKLLLLGDAARLLPLEMELKAEFGERIESVRTEDTLLQISSPKVNKAHAVRFVCNHYGIDPDDCAAMGDGMNDLGMLGAVGFGIAVANAVEPMLRAADWIAPPNNQDALAAAAKAFLQQTKK